MDTPLLELCPFIQGFSAHLTLRLKNTATVLNATINFNTLFYSNNDIKH